jgi:hypothetical protein
MDDGCIYDSWLRQICGVLLDSDEDLKLFLGVVGMGFKVPLVPSLTEQQACRCQSMLTRSRFLDVLHHVFRPQFHGIVLQGFAGSVNPFKNVGLAVAVGGENTKIRRTVAR